MSHLPDEICKALARPDGVSEETMRPLAAQFDEAARTINERLEEAVALLRKNLRSEAIQAANRRPNVMEMAASLDFPELPEWLEILQFLGVPVPQRIDKDKVQQLNEAIVEGQPIEELLKQHRRLAIAKAPLSWRLKVLRRIAEVDSMNPIWLEDVEVYEAVRRKTLAEEVGQAHESNDLSAIHKLHAELTESNWVSLPPNELADSLQQKISKNHFDNQVASLRETAEQLHDAFSEFNEPRARNLLSTWQTACSGVNASIPSDLMQEVEPALTWLAEIDAYAAEAQKRNDAFQALERALDSRRDLSALRKSYANASRFDEPVPPELEQQFRTLTEEIQLAEKRKTQLVTVAIVAATLLVAAGVAFWQYRQVEEQRIVAAVQQFSALVGGKRTDEATAFWNRLESQNPDLANNAELVYLYGNLENQITQETNRKHEFESYLNEASNDDPSIIDQASLNEAEKLAVSEEEKSRVFAVQQRLDQHERGMAEQQTALALKEIDAIRTKLDEFEASPLESVDPGDINTHVVTLDNIPALYPRRSRNVDAQVKIEKARATGLTTAAREYARRVKLLETARRPLYAATDLTTFRTALARYTQAIETPQFSREFEQSLKENKFWESGLASNQLPMELRRALAGGISKEEVQQLQTIQETVAEQTNNNPLLNEFRSVTSPVLSEEGDPTAALETLKSELSQLPIEQLVTIEASVAKEDGTTLRYFLYNQDYQRIRDKLEQSASIGIRHLADTSGAVKTSTIKGPVKRVHVEPGRSITWLRAELENRDDKFEQDWGPTFLKLCAEVRGRTDLDGLIKEELIYLLLQSCANGSSSMETMLSKPIVILQSRDASRLQWALPRLPSDKLATDIESQVIPSLSDVFTEIEQVTENLTPATQLEYRWIGFLLRDGDGKIVGRVNIKPSESGQVYIMRAAAQNPSQVDIVTVGTWQEDTLTLDENSPELNAGRPLFILGHDS